MSASRRLAAESSGARAVEAPVRRSDRLLLRSALLPLFLLTLVGTAAAVDVGAPAPELGINDLRGQPLRLASLRGKVVLLDFWATWCGPCRRELPVLQRLHQLYAAQGLAVVAVSVDDDLSDVQGFLARSPLGFRVAHDPRQVVLGRYGGRSMPSSYLIDRHGLVRRFHGGFRDGDAATFEREVQALLREP